MNFSMRPWFLVVLAGSFATISFCAVNPSQDHPDFFSALAVIEKAIADDLTILDACDPDNDWEDIDWACVDTVIKAKWPSLFTKVVNVIKYDLTEEQRACIITFLDKLKKISTTTTDDLMAMAKVCYKNYNRYASGNLKETREPGDKDELAVLEQVNFQNKSYNHVLEFVCHVHSFEEMGQLSVTDCRIPNLKKSLQYLCLYMANTGYSLNNWHFFAGWTKIFKNAGTLFSTVHFLSTSLLDRLDLDLDIYETQG